MSLGGLFRSIRKRVYDIQRAQVRPEPPARRVRAPRAVAAPRPESTKKRNIELDTTLPSLSGGAPRESNPKKLRAMGKKRGRKRCAC